MAPSLTGPQALYLYHLAKEVQASGARPDCHLYVEWQADAHRFYAQVAINALTLRDGSVEQLRGHITVLEVRGAEDGPSALAIRRAEAALMETAAMHDLDIADGELTYLLNDDDDPHRVLLYLRVTSRWYRALHVVRQHMVNGIPVGRVKPLHEFHLSLDGTADWTMSQVFDRWRLQHRP